MEPTDILYDICRYYVEDHKEVVDPAVLKKVDGYRRSKNVAGLTSCSLNFDQAKHSVREWRFLRQVEAFFKKNALLAKPEVCEQAAKATFFEAEAQCSETNRRLQPAIGYPYLIDEEFREQVAKAVRYISDVLGDFAPFLDELPHLVKVTSGATATASRRDSLPQLKLKLKLFATRGARKYLEEIYQYYGMPRPRIKIIKSNRVELVPKNWKTSRTIACEPEGNLPLQLAFDGYAKRRLRRFGIDLSSQSANQAYAKHASIFDDYVTVDLKTASSTVSFNTVSLLFPSDWFAYLLDVRTPCYRGVFGDGRYAMFSSMGNGATFTVETLIFAAVCHAVGSKDFKVYGDDIVIEKEFYEPFLRLIQFLGFTVNLDKSFSHGPFRESCGGDFFRGADVTPVYIRNIDSRKACLCHLVNVLGKIAFAGGKLEAFLIQLLKDEKLPLVPYSENTMSGVWIDPGVARTLRILRTRNGLLQYRAYVPVSTRRVFVDSRGYYLWFLNKTSQVSFNQPWENGLKSDPVTETSSAPVFQHVYVRKRVSWHPPAEGTPVHLHWWTEQVTSH